MSAKLVAAILVSLVVGVLVGLAAGQYIEKGDEAGGACQAETIELTPTALKKAEEKLNELIKQENPMLSVVLEKTNESASYTMSKVKAKVFYSGSQVDEIEYYVTVDGSKLFLKPIDLFAVSKPKRVEVSADDDPVRGDPDAPVTIVLFSDYACPFCRELEVNVTPKLLQVYNGTVKIVFRDFPVHGELSYVAAVAANCAGEQGKYWEFHDTLFLRQDEWVQFDENGEFNLTLARNKMVEFAEDNQLDLEKFRACVNDSSMREEVEKDFQDGMLYGVDSTPTMFVNGLMVRGYVDFDTLTTYVQREMS